MLNADAVAAVAESSALCAPAVKINSITSILKS